LACTTTLLRLWCWKGLLWATAAPELRLAVLKLEKVFLCSIIV
jgi:hypothetical protein